MDFCDLTAGAILYKIKLRRRGNAGSAILRAVRAFRTDKVLLIQ
jgi:hypothetical protein